MIQSSYECTDQKITSFKIHSSFEANADLVYKSHKIDIALFYDEKHVDVKEVLIQAKAETDLTDVFKGLPKPKAFLLDSGSYGFCKTTLDEESMNYLT